MNKSDSVIDNQDALLFIKYQPNHSQQLISNEINSAITGKKNVIIDFGCGFGSLERDIYKKARRIIAIDKSKAMINYAKQNNPAPKKITFIRDDVSKFKFPKNSADYCIMLFSLHHTKNKKIWLKNAYKSLKSGGKLLIVERLCVNSITKLIFPIYWYTYYKYKHEWAEEIPKIMSIKEIDKILKENGFKINEKRRLEYSNKFSLKSTILPRFMVIAQKQR